MAGPLLPGPARLRKQDYRRGPPLLAAPEKGSCARNRPGIRG
jgi:hypothetical protein